MHIELANQSIIDIWGKGNDVIGKSFKEVLPELDNQLVFEQIQKVFTTGESFHTKNTALDLIVDGLVRTYYFNYSFTPLYDISGNIYGVMNTGVDLTDLNIAKKRIEESEEQLRIAIEGGEFGTFDFTPQADQLIWSAKTKELFGLPPDAYVDYQIYLAALHPEDRGTSRAVAQQQANLKESGLYELEYRAIGITDGKLRWLRSRGKATYNKEGEAIRYTGVIQDITQQKEAAEVVRESNLRFRNTVKQAPVGITILRGPQYVVEMANNAYLELVDRKEEAFVGKPLFTVMPEVQPSVQALLDSVLNTGEPYHGNEVSIPLLRHGKQDIYYFDFLYHPLKEEDGKISGVIVTVTEVSEKVAARKKIEESEKRFRSLAESLPQLIWETDDKGHSLYASGRWKEYTGITPGGEEEWKAMIHPDDFENNAQSWVKSLETGELYRSDVRLKNKEGEYRWHRVIGEPVFDHQNKIVKWVGAFTDIQSEKAFTRELEKQVAERTQALEETNIELGKKNKELESFAYISSHDLQEPLRKIQTFATQIAASESQSLSPGGKEKFSRMQNAAKRMQALIDDLLAYSRTNTEERKFEKTSLIKIIEEVKEDVKEELQQKNASLVIKEMVEADIIPFQFRQLLLNLLNNSLKFSNPKEPPHITITSEMGKGSTFNLEKLEKDLHYCHIRFSDNGIGFDNQYNEKIFDVFQRLHGRHEFSGTGIGLAIVKRIVENHHGVITANGELDKGATFDIYIPTT